MANHLRCLYENSITGFLNDTDMTILGNLCDHYHGYELTTTKEAWIGEITIMQDVLSRLDDKSGRPQAEPSTPDP